MRELFKVCFTHMEGFSGSYPVNMGFLWSFLYKLGNGLHSEPQKENSNWCDWLWVRVGRVMKWHSLYQSVSHSITAVVPEYWLPLRPWLSLWETLFLPPPVFLVPFAPSPAFISTLQAVPFQSIISSPPTLALWERGKEGSRLRGVEFFYRSWHPLRSVTRHSALSFMLFFPPLLSFLKASFFYLSKKSHSSLPRKPVSFFPIFFTCVCFSPLECVSGSGRASLRTQTRKRQDFEWRKKTKVYT